MIQTLQTTQRVRLALVRLLPFLVMLVLLASFVLRNLAGASSEQGVVGPQTTASRVESDSLPTSLSGGTNGRLDKAETTTELTP